jgi:1-acyl-sn-glycerol-3-phosphate acyltransferase
MQARLSFLWYEVAYFFAHFATLLGCSLRTEGRHNLPRRGPVLVVANHQSVLDPILVGLSTRRHLRALARKTLYRHALLARVIDGLSAIPIDHEGVGKEGLKVVLAELGRGAAVLVFPEGTRTRDGVMHALRPGIHLVIKRVQAPIVPVGIAGAYEAWPPWQSCPLPAPLFLPASGRALAVSVGKPLDGRRFAALPREQALAELFQDLQKVAAQAERLRRKP